MKKLNRKIILLYLIGFLAIPVIVFIYFFIPSIPNQLDPNVNLFDGKGTIQTERTFLNPFICIHPYGGMGDGSFEFYCSLPELFITTIGWFVPAGIIFSLWIIYLCLGPFIFLIIHFTGKKKK
jgi:hypothetical protein